jgi:sensor histidine kinase regulating citrate/malate metabolism
MRPAHATFQTKFFFAALSASVIALAVAGLLFATTMRRQTNERIEATLVSEARMVADLLARITSSCLAPASRSSRRTAA